MLTPLCWIQVAAVADDATYGDATATTTSNKCHTFVVLFPQLLPAAASENVMSNQHGTSLLE
jgi:hypothetical protein